MESVKKHFILFPPDLRSALEKFSRWDHICEIRLRKNLPLSLTSFQENILIDKNGQKCGLKDAITCTGKDLNYLLGTFCSGSVYRYFHNLSTGFAVDDDGWRLGICSEKKAGGDFIPEEPSGINLRIPRLLPTAADDLISRIKNDSLSSTLILSAPGEGKTTLLRALALKLASGSMGSPLRVAVIDEKQELFPKNYGESGLVDLLSGYEKKEGIELAIRLFSPQVILCDEIGNEKEVSAILSSCTGGCTVIASCHAVGLDNAKRIKILKPLIESGLFKKAVTIRREKGDEYKRRLLFEEIL